MIRRCDAGPTHLRGEIRLPARRLSLVWPRAFPGENSAERKGQAGSGFVERVMTTFGLMKLHFGVVLVELVEILYHLFPEIPASDNLHLRHTGRPILRLAVVGDNIVGFSTSSRRPCRLGPSRLIRGRRAGLVGCQGGARSLRCVTKERRQTVCWSGRREAYREFAIEAFAIAHPGRAGVSWSLVLHRWWGTGVCVWRVCRKRSTERRRCRYVRVRGRG